MAACLLLVLGAPSVQAQASTLSLTLVETVNGNPFAACEKSWPSDQIVHFRDCAWTSTFQGQFADGGEFTGEGSGLLSANLNTVSGDGELFGEFSWTFHGDWHDGVTFYGRFSGTIDGGVIHDFIWAHGEGMQLMGQGVSPGEGFHGTILIPHG